MAGPGLCGARGSKRFGIDLRAPSSLVSYEYIAYGLSLRSDVELPGLKQGDGPRAARPVCLTTHRKLAWVNEASQLPFKVIHSLPAEPESGDPAFVVRASDGGGFFQLSYSDGMEFLVDAGADLVWGTFSAPLTIEDLSTYLLGPVMGFVLRRRGVTPLHASAVRIGDTAVAIAGEAGGGKSTTAAALALRGSAALCEDIAALHESEGRFYVEPGYPRVCLWPDAVEKLLGSKDALPNLTPTWDKKCLGLDGVRARFEPRRMPLGAIYLLAVRSEEETAPRIEEISPRAALLELVRNTYMNLFLTREQRAAEFELLSRLVNHVPCRQLTPHREASKIGKLCELIEKDARTILGNRQQRLAIQRE
jgi:hypothetical protein